MKNILLNIKKEVNRNGECNNAVFAKAERGARSNAAADRGCDGRTDWHDRKVSIGG
nr:MAG TPA: hypothetical protein [Caudoviricetes sp.]